jgi:hypothetical protein
MQRKTKEFQDVRYNFEKLIRSNACPYIPSSKLERDNSGGKSTFYADGHVNAAFQFYMQGYSLGKCMYMGEEKNEQA